MSHFNTQNHNQSLVENINLQQHQHEANMLANHNINMDFHVNWFSKNVKKLEKFNSRHWHAQMQHSQIVNDAQISHNYLKQKEQSIVQDINTYYGPTRLYRDREKYYFKPTPFSDFISGTREEIANEISRFYGNVNIIFVSDLNDALPYNNPEVRIDTTYIADGSIPYIPYEDFNPATGNEVYIDFQGLFVRNHYKSIAHLASRHQEFTLNEEAESYPKEVISKISNMKDAKFLLNRLGKSFKHLNSSNAIVLVDNKDVSVGVLMKKVLKPIYGSSFTVKITDEMLQTMSKEEILKNKLLYHIDHIPEDEESQEKLRDILFTTLVDRCMEIDNKVVPVYGQVIITVDQAHPFLKDFLSLSDVFFVDSMDNIFKNLGEEDKASFHKKIYEGLTGFSQELSAIGNLPEDLSTDNSAAKEKFIDMLDQIDETIVNLVQDNLLDPFSSTFQELIPVAERYKHTHVTGMTGSGKSELLKALIMADIARDDGSIILLEPHGDLAASVVKLVRDKSRLVYIDPFLSESHTPTINLFHTLNKSEANIARLTQVILSVLKSVSSDENFSGAMEDVAEMCTRVLIRKGNSSFQEFYRFLNDNRNDDLVEIGINSPNPLESEYFEDDFSALTKTKDALRRRLKKLLNDPIFSNMMNGANTIDLEEAMNTRGKIIVFNIPKGKMPNTYKYYIRFIVEYIQILALKRADAAEEFRVHTHLYIDEAHNFITSTSTMSEILTESRKYRLYITFAHQAITQIRDTNLRDIMTTMTNVKIIGKNSNKTLEAMNKTLNTKLKDVEKLKTGEFYVVAGNNNTIKANVTDRLLSGREDISPSEQIEQKQYQLSYNYRPLVSMQSKAELQEQINQGLNDFIVAIKSIDIAYFDKVRINPILHEELVYNFNDESDDASGYISKQDLYLYFNLIYPEYTIANNKELLKLLKNRDDFFKQNVNSHKTYNGKKRLLIS